MKKEGVRQANHQIGRLSCACAASLMAAYLMAVSLTHVEAQEASNTNRPRGERPNILFAIADDWAFRESPHPRLWRTISPIWGKLGKMIAHRGPAVGC